MVLRLILVMISCICETYPYQIHVRQKYNTWDNAASAPHRLLQIMTAYTEEAGQRIQELNPLRFMYEQSPHYEQGYVIGEIIERFQKVVNHAQRPILYKSDNFFNALKRTELIQLLSFEIYHLVRIMHEIPQKYKSDPEFAEEKKDKDKEFEEKIKAKLKEKFKDKMKDEEDEVKGNRTEFSYKEMWEVQKHVADMQRRREKERRRRRRKNAKLRNKYLNGVNKDIGYGKNRRPENKLWPYDYGWGEVDYVW